MPFARFLFLIAIFIFFAAEPRLGADVEVPIRFSHNLVWIDVHAAGRRDPLHFLFDTGAGATVINADTATEMGLHFGGYEPIRGVNGSGGARWASGLRGEAAGLNMPGSLLAVSLRNASRSCGQRIDGLLSLSFFQGRVVQIDYRAGKLRLLERSPAISTGAFSLPMRRLNDAFGIPISVAGNPPEWMRLDTGCDEALLWNPGKHDRLGSSSRVSIALSSHAPEPMRADVRLGADGFSNLSIGVQGTEIFPGESGLLGNGLLSRYRVTIDPGKKSVAFEKQ